MTRFRGLLALVLAVFSLPATSWAQTEIQIAASKDNTLYQNNAGAFSNGLGHFLFAGLNNHSEARRGLLAFDLSGKIPPGAKIISAKLTASAVGFHTWESTPEMVADVQAWLDTPANNFGWLLLSNESVKGGTKRFDSLQNPVAANRPDLRVIYSTASPVTAENISSLRSYTLGQNYPNPFNPSTTIHFELPVAEEVALVIYNTRGQSVRQLAKGKFARSAHQAVWDGRDDAGVHVPSGIYIFRLETANFTATRKLALVR